MKRHKVKREMQEPSSSFTKEQEEHDLAYYIHDRVELMHQVFSSLKYKELKAMAPECIRHISIDDLQELCTEELLGISSKRLCAILDGAEPPSDTESSSRSPSPPFETISLDSISSDDEILSETSRSSKKNKKHKRKHARDKSKKRDKRKSKDDQPEEDAERSKASRAGLTVLELLELQARARAIRAQLQKEQLPKQTSELAAPTSTHSSDNEVEIKEEPAEVVEISSEDEKPNIEELDKENEKTEETSKSQQEPTSVTKRINDLIITIPQSKQTRKIKLNRSHAPVNTSVAGNTKENPNSVTVSKVNEGKKSTSSTDADVSKSKDKETASKAKTNVESAKRSETNVATKVINVDKMKDKEVSVANTKTKAKKTKTKKKKKLKLNIEEDHDEITLQLSDSEKMDLLEDLDRKNLDNVSSSSADSESSSDTSDEETSLESVNKDKKNIDSNEKVNEAVKEKERINNEANIEVKECNTSNNEELKSCIEKDIENGNKVSQISAAKENEPRKNNVTTFKNNTENTDKIITNSKDDEQTDSDTIQRTESTETNIQKDNNTIELPDIKDIGSIDQRDISEGIIGHTEPSFDKSENQKSNSIDIQEDKDGAEEKIKNFETTKTEISSRNNEIDIIMVKESNTDDNVQPIETTNRTNNAKETVNFENPNNRDNSDNSNKNIKDTKVKETLSDGELVDNESSEIEVTDLKLEVVCISDEEVGKKKKKKKDKKKKKSKKKSDFRKGDDQNFYEDKTVNTNINDTIYNNKSTNEIKMYSNNDHTSNNESNNTSKEKSKSNKNPTNKVEAFIINEDSIDHESNKTLTDANVSIDNTLNTNNKKSKDNIYIIVEDEILILSDDSSCYEVDSYLSKEPTAEEIEALSLKIDEINRDEIVSESEIREHERQVKQKEKCCIYNKLKDNDDIAEIIVIDSERDTNGDEEGHFRDIENIEDNISWKDRYLGSKKVKKVLSTANIFNALRKKNIELKKRLEDKRLEDKIIDDSKKEEEKTKNKDAEVGSVDHYNTLQGSTKYVDPVKEIEEQVCQEKESEEKKKGVTNEMKRDAKHLLKMYKKLLKYNDMNKVKDPSKRKKKKKNKES